MAKERGIGRFLATIVLLIAAALPAMAQLPEGFKARDIGEPGAAGSTTYDAASGKFTVNGAGADLWGNDSDHFQFVSKEVTGDGNITARLLSTTGGHAEDGWEKVGAMIRENDTQGSPHATTYMSNRGGGVYFMWREAQDEATQEIPGFAPRRFPIFLRTQRVGNEFSGFYSFDGVFWNFNSTQTVTMAEKANFGLHEMSHEDGVLSTSTWDNVSVNPGVTQVYGLTACGNDNGVLLQWKALKGATAYNVYRGPANAAAADLKLEQLAKVNTDTVAGSTFSDVSADLVPGARYLYAVRAVTGGQEGPPTAIVSGKTGPATPPAGFTYTVVGENKEGECGLGSVGVSQDAAGVITMRSGGHDIWDDGDDFTFLHQKVTGNVRITVTMLTLPTATSSWAKAGPMVRETVQRGSRNAFMEVTGYEGAVSGWRSETNGASASDDSENGNRALNWAGSRDAVANGKTIQLRLTRQGDTVTPEYSLDGTTFQSGGPPITLSSLTADVEVGVAHTSHDVGRISQVQFRDVKIEKL